MSEPAFAIDHHDDGLSEYETHWMIEPPEPGVGFRVLNEQWNADYTVRKIYAIQLVNVRAGGPSIERRPVEDE